LTDRKVPTPEDIDAAMNEVWEQGAMPEWLLFKDADGSYGVFEGDKVLRNQDEVGASCKAVLGFDPREKP
jgi:hypothetical protein